MMTTEGEFVSFVKFKSFVLKRGEPTGLMVFLGLNKLKAGFLLPSLLCFRIPCKASSAFSRVSNLSSFV